MKKVYGVLLLIFSGVAQPVVAEPFQKTLDLQGIRFEVSSPNDSSLSKLTIKPSGLKGENSVITQEVDGTVTGAEVADLDANGFPEIYVYITSAGSGSYSSLVAYASNKNKSLTEIHLPPVADNPAASKGYMGHLASLNSLRRVSTKCGQDQFVDDLNGAWRNRTQGTHHPAFAITMNGSCTQ